MQAVEQQKHKSMACARMAVVCYSRTHRSGEEAVLQRREHAVRYASCNLVNCCTSV